jgi:hypothetical protein
MLSLDTLADRSGCWQLVSYQLESLTFVAPPFLWLKRRGLVQGSALCWSESYKFSPTGPFSSRPAKNWASTSSEIFATNALGC